MTLKYRSARNRKKTAQIEWLSNEKISRNSIIGDENKSNSGLALMYTAAITLNFIHLQHNVHISFPSMILTRETGRVLIRFKQVLFPLQWWVFQCISQFLLQIVSSHFQLFFLRYLVVLTFSAEVLQKNLSCNDFKQKKRLMLLIHILQLPTMMLLNLSIQFLATRDKLLPIDH